MAKETDLRCVLDRKTTRQDAAGRARLDSIGEATRWSPWTFIGIGNHILWRFDLPFFGTPRSSTSNISNILLHVVYRTVSMAL